MENVKPEVIEDFLVGRDSEEYIVAVEGSYDSRDIFLVINDPKQGKYIRKDKLTPFLWAKQEGLDRLYNGERSVIKKKMTEFGIKILPLKTEDENGHTPTRLANGYKYLVQCSKTYTDLIKFFDDGGLEIFNENKDYYVTLAVEIQYLIQTGKRLFKGFEEYNDLHRFQFDLETTGLKADRGDRIFQIGMKDNRGFEHVLEIKGDTEDELDIREINAIITFFNILNELKPDIIAGYNSEFFDFDFIEKRVSELGYDLSIIAKTLNPKIPMKRKNSTVKFGSETENYKKTVIWGTNVLDISHAVRRAQAINSDMKSWSLKYVTKFSKVAKDNRVYVPGDKIHTTWYDAVNNYAFNNINGDWYIISDNKPLKEGYEVVKGDYIVQRYLLDDLWETEQVDEIYNQASFLLGKLLPIPYARTTTMGNAVVWKTIMCTWSFEQGLALPSLLPKTEFTGGLSRLLNVGYAKNIVKLDYAALYPNTQITNNIFPDLDITGVLPGILIYIADTRDKYKNLKNELSAQAKEIRKEIKENLLLTEEEKIFKRAEAIKLEKLASNYDKKQLPLKILANSFFGGYGAPYIFNWGDTDCAEETTCRGRQYLRLMVRFFSEKHGFTALVGDSVTHDTPIYIRYENGDFDIKAISDIFNEKSDFLDNEKLRDYEKKPFEVLTRSGWRKINYVYRHATNKKIHRITTKDRLVNVTEDHSLFQNGEQIKPSQLKRGDKIDIFHLNIAHKDVSLNENVAWLYGFFLGDGSSLNSRRKTLYKSRKTGEMHEYRIKRADWKISNTNLEFLNKLKNILEVELGINSTIKDHRKSSGVYNLVVHNAKFADYFCENFYSLYREKKIPSIILNANLNIQRMFIEGVCASDGYGNTIETCVSIGMKSQVAMAGIGFLLQNLGIEYKILTRKDKQNFITLSLKNRSVSSEKLTNFTNRTLKKSDEVWGNNLILNKDKNNYVYDISTEDGTFIGGIGALVLKNTDGFNFMYPESINEFTYKSSGKHRFNKKDEIYSGVEAVVAEFNDLYMEGRMGLDIDEYCEATINFSKKNYANKMQGKIKIVGNTFKSKTMPTYIEEFIAEGVKLLLDNKGSEFIEYYYSYIKKIYNYEISVAKIASKAKVKSTVKEYLEKIKIPNKAGNDAPRKAHMELIIANNVPAGLGDTIYYVNTGKKKSDGDIKTKTDKKTKNKERILNCKLIPSDEIENNPDLIVDDYNVDKYIDMLNKKVETMIVCFKKDIRDRIIQKLVKDKKTKELYLTERSFFTAEETELVAGQPIDDDDQDDYKLDLMDMEDKEISFWLRMNKVPNDINLDEWENIKIDYLERKEKKRQEDILLLQNHLDDAFRRLETQQLNLIASTNKIPKSITDLVDINEEVTHFISKELNANIAPFSDLFKYKEEASLRDIFYKMIGNTYTDKPRYDQWLDYLVTRRALSGNTQTLTSKDYQVEREILNAKLHASD